MGTCIHTHLRPLLSLLLLLLYTLFRFAVVQIQQHYYYVYVMETQTYTHTHAHAMMHTLYYLYTRSEYNNTSTHARIQTNRNRFLQNTPRGGCVRVYMYVHAMLMCVLRRCWLFLHSRLHQVNGIACTSVVWKNVFSCDMLLYVNACVLVHLSLSRSLSLALIRSFVCSFFAAVYRCSMYVVYAIRFYYCVSGCSCV